MSQKNKYNSIKSCRSNALFKVIYFFSLYCFFSLAAYADHARIQDLPWKKIFPEATQYSEFSGTPPVATIFRNNQEIGYLFSTKQITPIPAYSGKPVDVLVGMDLNGIIIGAKVIEHHEPILLVGIPESTLDNFVNQYIGKSVNDRIKVGAGQRLDFVNVDAITGATVTVMVMNSAIMRSARKVAIDKGIITGGDSLIKPHATVRTEYFTKANWGTLTGNGAINRMLLKRGEIDASFKGTEGENIDVATEEEANDTFIDLHYAYLNAPTIGQNLLGSDQYKWLMSELKPDEHAIALMANGDYSFKGSGYVRGGIFDRIQVLQGTHEVSFRDLDYHRLSDVYAEGMPEFSELAIFIIRKQYDFDPGQPWELELLIKRQTGPLESVFSSFGANYEIPGEYVEQPVISAEIEEPIWKAVWRDRTFEIIVLVTALGILTLIMALQDWLVRFPRLLAYLRTGFLLYTLLFIGWYLLGQLSVVNVFTFTSSVMHNFSWDTFLIDPTMFILWGFVACSILLWGRGVYCGWLCPYGALQKLVNSAARALNVRQFQLPQMIHDRLWGIKYIILLLLFAVSMESLTTAEQYAEVEPFKTAITLRFNRELPFVLYALGFVVISIFNCKFYCKYLCPLGAALAVPAKLSLVNWLRRRKECGNPCQTCAVECEIQAITETGEIQINECHYCMDCQVTYWDDQKCPPLVVRRKRLEKRQHNVTFTKP